MTNTTQDIRNEILSQVQADASTATSPMPQQLALVETWLASLESEDLVDVTATSLASILWQGFSGIAQCHAQSCRIVALRYADGRGGWASALLIHNPDMPFLVDSIVMAMRRLNVASHAVLNAVLTVRRGSDDQIIDVARARTGGDALESIVLCLLQEELLAVDQASLIKAIELVANDAAAVRRDGYALNSAMTAAAAAAGRNAQHGASSAEVDDTIETAAFLEWALDSGYEAFGYAYYRAMPGSRELICDLDSRIGVLRDPNHPVYDHCLAGITGDYDALAGRINALSVVKADAESTLHRDQHLDFIGVREKDAQGAIVGEHCFIGLFSRAATLTPLAQLPFVRGRIAQVMKLAGVRKQGFRAEKFLEILDSLPRTEVFESDPEFLATLCSTVVALSKQPRARVFARRDVYGRHLNLLIYLPRERFSEALTVKLVESVRGLSGANDVQVQTLLADGPLARIYLIASLARLNMALDVNIEQPLLAAIEGWPSAFEDLVDAGMVVAQRASMRKLGAALPPDYVMRTTPATAYRDLHDFLTIQETPRIKLYVEAGVQGAMEIRLLSVANPPSLARILPALQNAGVAVDREQTYQIGGVDTTTFYATCLTVDAHSAVRLAQANVADAAQEMFELLLNDEVEDGRMNGLVLEAGLRTREVQVIRAYASYWRQAGCRFSLRYIADCLKRQSAAVRTLIQGFLLRFDPALDAVERQRGTATLSALRQDLASVNHADTEDILKSLTDLMLATLRTSYFQEKQVGDILIFKFDSSALSLLPQPRPFRELFVFARRFEGVHLRGGPVARGGLRWSDRMEDYRTEVLGLVKAQMVKNAVIVPAGAKGGFVCKQLSADATRDVRAAEGEAVYRLFIAGLLDMTDNRANGEIVVPVQTVCYDEADPYLVVAADKGTATFSDIANGIAVSRGFWLGDAFASGGSNGYDHKKLGITAKGAWEAVKRHFFELGHDLETTPITMTGVGDMSGDVFGNGLLLSRQVRLVAAFDHRHIFIDPTPDTATSYAERERLFALPRSSWEDYDKGLISEGGGVWARSLRTIELSPQIRVALGTTVTSATPEQLLHLILLAPVDLFYNGGIGTYIKASTETNAAVKDRANDNIRVDGNQLRCRVVAEGGNLGATQAGRIEFALAGGHIFTDAIDNSAGVDCSDHEVNVKIWLDTEVAAGSIDVAERNRVLTSITDDIETLVLRDNIQQTHLLAREEQAQVEPSVRAGYAALIERLESADLIIRSLEQLPDVAELARREAAAHGLTAPELAVVIAHEKNRYKRLLSALPLTGYEWSRTLLAPYFPPALVATRDALAHPLANAILATILANEAINRCGPILIHALAQHNSVAETDVILAWARGWSVLNLGQLFTVLDTYALQVTPELSRKVDRRTRALLAAVISGVLSIPVVSINAVGTNSDDSVGVGHDALAELTQLFATGDGAPGTARPNSVTPGTAAQEITLAPMPWLESLPAVQNEVSDADTSEAQTPAAFVMASQRIATIEAVANFLFAAIAVERPAHMSLPLLLQCGFQVRHRSGIDVLERTLMHAEASAGQQGLRTQALHALRRAQRDLLASLLHDLTSTSPADTELGKRIDAHLAQLPVPLLDLTTSAAPLSIEQAILAAWTFSESLSQKEATA